MKTDSGIDPDKDSRPIPDKNNALKSPISAPSPLKADDTSDCETLH